MVYAPPPAAPSSDASSHSFRPAHRRTRSHNVAATPTDTTPAAGANGAFAPMAHLPRRKTRKAFYLEDEPPSPEPEEEDGPSPLSPLAIDTNVHAFPSIPTYDRHDPKPQSVPFPRTSSETFSPSPAQRPGFSPRPSFSRSPSSPMIMLSNGKPLKSSLKSSQSAPHIPDELRMHMRVKSEPSTPSAKSVHFRDDDEIEDVKVYNRQGRPANLLVKPGEETETETEVEGAFPFPRTMGGTAPSPPSSTSPPADQLPFEIDNAPGKASLVPRPTPEPWANVHLESVSLPRTRPAAIRGSVLVRNVVFEKNVVVRFTLDDWQTTSEVVCKHVVSLPGLPPPFPPASDSGHGWDRFSFQISLEDYVGKLAEKTLFLVVRFGAPGHGDWWDNNAGSNYRVVFKKSPPPPASPMEGLAHSQQRGFVAPSTLRATPPSVPSLASTLYASVAAPELSTPDLYPSAITGKLTASPAGSPTVTPRRSPSGSPPGSDSENRKPPTRRRPGMGLGLGLGVNGSSRPPALARSMSSPPVFTPPLAAATNGFLAQAQAPPAPAVRTRGAPPGRQQVDGNISPLMARLSRLSLSNYAAPSKPVPARSASFEEVKDKGGESPVLEKSQQIVGGHYATYVPDPSATPEVKVTASSPPALSEQSTPKPPSPSATPKPSTAVRIPSPRSSSPLAQSESAETLSPAAATTSPENSLSTSPVATSSTSTSATNSPLLSTPLGSSLTDIPSLAQPKQTELTTRGSLWEPLKRADSPPKRQSRERDTSGSGSDSSSSSSTTRRAGTPRTTFKSADLVLNMPTPLARGDANSPFSPVSTPRFSLDASLLAAGARASPNSARGRVDTNDADYHAFVRQWCFARSPSPGASPAGTPADELSAAPLHTVRVQVAVPRTDSPLRRAEARTSPHGSNGSSPSFTPNASFERTPWLGMGEGYGLGMGRSWEAGKA